MARALKLTKLIPHIIYIIVLSYFISRMPKKLYTVKKITRFQQDMKHVLLWTDVPGFDEEGQRIFLKRNCQTKGCYISKNKSLFGDVRYFDAILFNVEEISERKIELPSVRSGLQKYIFVAKESADNYPVCDEVYDDFFNWTWTYRIDSTIPYRFFAVRNLHDQDLGTGYFQHHTKIIGLDKFLKSQLYSKSKAAVIFLDKCKSRSKREDFVFELNKELEKYNLSVDVYGKCGKQCARKTMAPCFWRLRKNYFFYLALEDSVAVDYITEHILYGYKYNAVPIVYGGANYSEFLPKNSYISAVDTDNKHLASLINDLIQNRSRYYDYFEWKNHYTVTDHPVLDPCSLCRTLNYEPWLTHRVSYIFFREWWSSNYKTRCSEDSKFTWF